MEVCVHQVTKHADGVEAMAVTDPAFARLVDLGVPRNARLDAAWVSDNETAPQRCGSRGCWSAQRITPVAAPPTGTAIKRSVTGK